ncbi:MAG TPA: M23 family metallopeptidase [Candidatus Hydrogenedens sp.]|nr:M23 family metallopeptidase [Candidatus Hydrogenedens sp.]
MGFITIFFTFIFLTIHFSFSDSSFVPPLNGDLYATSSFGEYRDGRFHAGVDYRASIKTPVYAIDDGYVTRLRCGPWGYGRALYIQFRSGIMGVYGHLHSFAEPYQSYLHKIQHQKQSFSVDLTLNENELPVKKGSIIAYTGQSGTKAPHLHFELRSKDGITCLNPWEYGFQWIDRDSPQISSLLLVPGDINTTINGHCLPVEIPVNEKTSFPVIVHAKGTLGFGINTVDLESTSCKLGPYCISMTSSGTVSAIVQQDRIDYNTYRDAAVAFYPYISNPVYWVLWQWQGNRSPNYRQAKNGWLFVSDDEHVKIEVVDFSGKKTEVPIYISTQDIENQQQKNSAKKSGVFIHYLPQFLVLEIALPLGTNNKEPSVSCISQLDNKVISLTVIQRSANVYEVPWQPHTSGKYTFKISHTSLPLWEKTIYAIKTAEPIEPIIVDNMEIKIPSNAPYGVLWLSISSMTTQTVSKGLTLTSEIWKMEPINMPIAEPVQLKMRIAENTQYKERVSIYRKTGSSWSRVKSKQNGDFVIGSLIDWGAFALLRDDTPPEITNVSITDIAKNPTNRPAISCSISDIGSGIVNAEIYCDKKWLLAEYDGPRGTLRWEQDEDLTSGKHTITFLVADYTGLAKKEVRTITVP